MVLKPRPTAARLVFLLVAEALLCAAADPGQLTGTVKDPAGAVITGAHVSLKDSQGSVKPELCTPPKLCWLVEGATPFGTPENSALKQ